MDDQPDDMRPWGAKGYSVYTQKKHNSNTKDEFSSAKRQDPKNVKVIRNFQVLRKIKQPSEITREQIYISGLLLSLLLIPIYMILNSKLHETTFSALFIFLIVVVLFVLFYRSIRRVSVGPKGVEFEMGTERR
jgi:hypothetical protein